MGEELKRILRMVREGRLTEEQAESMIAAIQGEDREEAEQIADDESPSWQEERSHRGRRRQRRRGRRGTHLDEDYLAGLGEQVAAVVDNSVRGASWVLRHADRLGPVAWVNDANASVLSRLEKPEGDDYTCEDNHFNVSQLRQLTLSSASFCENELNASAIREVEIAHGEFRGNALHGSSLKQASIDQGNVLGCELNGAQISNLRITRGKLAESVFSGAQLRELTIDDGSIVDSKFSGANVKGFDVSGGASVQNLSVSGSKCRDLSIEGGDIDGLRFSGMRVKSCQIRHSTFRDVAFKHKRWRDEDDDLVLPRLTDLTFDSVTAENVRFVNCRFDGTVFRNCEVKDLTFTGVDFTDLAIDSAEAALALADEAAA